MDDLLSNIRPLVSLAGAGDADPDVTVRFPPGLGLIPPRDFTSLRVKPKTSTEWHG
jgi:hypothetical protein